MRIAVMILIILLIISAVKQFTYYCAIRGLLYYLTYKYNDMPDEEKAKELTEGAIKRTIREFFRLTG